MKSMKVHVSVYPDGQWAVETAPNFDATSKIQVGRDASCRRRPCGFVSEVPPLESWTHQTVRNAWILEIFVQPTVSLSKKKYLINVSYACFYLTQHLIENNTRAIRRLRRVTKKLLRAPQKLSILTWAGYLTTKFYYCPFIGGYLKIC
jgi:hypothetical protein